VQGLDFKLTPVPKLSWVYFTV